MRPRCDQPTLADLRATVQKGRHREIGNVLARRWARPSAVYGTWVAVRWGLSAHQVTLLALLTSLGSALGVGVGTRTGFVVGVALAFTAFWLDRVDGQVARWRGTSGLDGVFFDYVMHHVATLTLGFALGQGLAARTGDTRWSLAGFAIALGWAVLSLQNDCRYKAFFQRLKGGRSTYRVSCGSGGRPAPPAPWPRRGRGLLTWPLYKMCEQHVVLMGLALLAFVALFAPSIWELGWKGSTLAMALLAPALAAGRVARAITRGAVEAEFARWFQADEAEVEALDGRPTSAV